MFGLLATGSVATTIVVPLSCSVNKDNKPSITVDADQKEIKADDLNVTVKGTVGAKLTNIKLIDKSEEFATAENTTIDVDGTAVVTFTLKTTPTQTVSNLILTYCIDGVEGQPIDGFEYKVETTTDALCFTDIAGDGKNCQITYTINGHSGEKWLQYSLNNGATWNEWTQGKYVALDDGQKLYVKNTQSVLSEQQEYFMFGTTELCNVSGNIMSMINYSNSLYNYCFSHVFEYCRIVDASELQLPTEGITPYCFYSMFYGCHYLEKQPQLLAKTLAEHCYDSMFLETGEKLEPQELLLEDVTLANGCYAKMYRASGIMFGESEDGTIPLGGHKMFTCPDTKAFTENPFTDIFGRTEGSFKGTPTEGKTYYWYTE